MNTFSALFAIVADATLKVTVLLLLAWAAARLLKNRSSSSRHMVRTFALAAALLLPLLSSLLPEWHVNGVPQLMSATAPKTVMEPVAAPITFSERKSASSQLMATRRAERMRERVVEIPRPRPDAVSPVPRTDGKPAA